MSSAWEFANGAIGTVARRTGHGLPFRANAEIHSLALSALGTFLFEWDVVADHISRPAGLEQLYGYSIDEVEPTFLWLRNLIHPDDVQEDRERFLSQVKARAPIIRGQYRVRHKDGRWITVRTAGSAEYADDGRLLRIVGCTMDIDETSILEEAHARLAAVVQHTNDAVFSVDSDGLISSWNAGAERLYGYTAQEAVGLPLARLAPSGDEETTSSRLKDVLSGRTMVFQARRQRKDKSVATVEISGAPIRSASGRILGVSTIHRDIAEARRVALADARLAAIVDASRDAILGLDEKGNVQSWNKGAETLFGWNSGEAIGRPAEFIVPEKLLKENDLIARRIRAGEAFVSETVRLAKDGSPRAVSASFTPLLELGQHVGTAIIYRDISDRIARESHIHVLLKELSHRSKNLLAVVQGIARQSATRAQDFPSFLESFTARLQALAHAHDLLVQENWYGADMHALIRAQTGAFGEIGEDAIRIEGPPLLVKPDAAQNIGLTMHELASNALRYGALSTGKGHVDIEWKIIDGENGPRFRLLWSEKGGPAAALPKRGGFGFLVVTQITPRALGGVATVSADDGGLVWTLEAPVANIAA